MIKPTIGRKVWFRPNGSAFPGIVYTRDNQPLDATIVYVENEFTVNLAVLDHAGIGYSVTGVTLVGNCPTPGHGTAYCEWMPYQLGQAKTGSAA